MTADVLILDLGEEVLDVAYGSLNLLTNSKVDITSLVDKLLECMFSDSVLDALERTQYELECKLSEIVEPIALYEFSADVYDLGLTIYQSFVKLGVYEQSVPCAYEVNSWLDPTRVILTLALPYEIDRSKHLLIVPK